MSRNITLTEKQAEALEAFCEAFDLCTTGQWTTVAQHMTYAGVDDPEGALEEAREALRG
jgi:hypothetical protein